jgi:hypothetical protein
MRPQRARLAAWGIVALCWSSAGLAAPQEVDLLPTVTPAPGTDCGHPTWKRPDADDSAKLLGRARKLDAILSEAVQDLGFTLDISRRRGRGRIDVSEAALVGQAGDAWVVSPRLLTEGRSLELRLIAVAPGSNVVLSRVEDVSEGDLEVRALVMLRDLMGTSKRAAEPHEPLAPEPKPAAAVERTRSPGRAVLALNSAVLGGYIGLSLQRASGSDDARLTYPLTALGAFVGIGASMIVAEEWDVRVGDAWYLAAGTWWPAAAGILLADGYRVEPVQDRYVYGLAGAGAGITLATVALSMHGISDGGATLTHSGGALGTLLGGVMQAWYEGSTDLKPTRGMGYGAGLGVLLAGAAATQVEVSSSRVLLVDLMAGLGGLTGAALASPAVFGDKVTTGEKRAWLASVALGTVLGGATGFAVTRPERLQQRSSWHAAPYAGPIAYAAGPGESPALGAGVLGRW